MVKVQNLTKRFGKRLALDQVSLDLNEGIYGLLGPNGVRYILKISTT